MRLFYCPKCKKEEIREDNPYKYEETIINMRDGWGRPITHYKCECGNYLAGSMDVNGWEDDSDAILYCKETIEGYNPGGCFYENSVGLNGDKLDMHERAKKVYEERRSKWSRRIPSLFEHRFKEKKDMSYLNTGGKGIPLKEIINHLGNKNYCYIECRCKWIDRNNQKQDDFFGACSYIDGALYPLDGDSYSLDDLYIEWEEIVEDGKLILIVWEAGELSTE